MKKEITKKNETIKGPIKNPRVTEKGSYMAEKNVYTFNVAVDANKTEIKKAIFRVYKVKPIRVNILAVPKKNASYKGRPSTKGGGKKAFVYLKKGDTIEFV